MLEPTPESVVVDLAAVVGEYARHQRGLIDLLRQFRATQLAEPIPSPLGRRHLQLLPPPPSRRHAPAPPAWRQPTAIAVWDQEMFGSSVHRTKHDYDYFEELDRKLAHLPHPPAAG